MPFMRRSSFLPPLLLGQLSIPSVPAYMQAHKIGRLCRAIYDRSATTLAAHCNLRTVGFALHGREHQPLMYIAGGNP
ncbi:hypothetical protein C8R47DRAFT_1120201 [Mycena vitilis]|nr:hypothetical protein C8R47DRAFT_1120201 [Mycena vitilis]